MPGIVITIVAVVVALVIAIPVTAVIATSKHQKEF